MQYLFSVCKENTISIDKQHQVTLIDQTTPIAFVFVFIVIICIKCIKNVQMLVQTYCLSAAAALAACVRSYGIAHVKHRIVYYLLRVLSLQFIEIS